LIDPKVSVGSIFTGRMGRISPAQGHEARRFVPASLANIDGAA
jgi:hypothetical protein